MQPDLDPEALRAAREFLFGSRSTSAAPVPAAPTKAAPTKEEKKPDERIGAMLESQQRRLREIDHGTSASTALSNAPGTEPLSDFQLSATDVRRSRDGWRAKCHHKRGIDSRHVSDARYGGYLRSFIHAIDVRDHFYRQRRLPIPSEIEVVVDGQRLAPEIVREDDRVLVRWQGQEHEVTGNDAEEIATEIALDLFVEFLLKLPQAAPPQP